MGLGSLLALSLCRDSGGFGCLLLPPVGVRQHRSLHRSQQKAWLWLGRRVPTCWPSLPGCCWCPLAMTNTTCLQKSLVVVVVWCFLFFNWKTEISCNLEKMPCPQLTGPSVPGPSPPIFWGQKEMGPMNSSAQLSARVSAQVSSPPVYVAL